MRAFFALIDQLSDLLTFPADNAAYPATPSEIQAEYARLAATPPAQPLARPVVIIAGYHAPPLQPRALQERLTSLTSAPAHAFACLSYQHHIITDRVIDSLCDALASTHPRLIDTADPTRSIEVDIIGISAGGLFARALSLPRFGTQHRTLVLRPRRIFTIGTPHRGAILARDIQLDPMGLDLNTGSAFLKHLDTTPPPSPYDLTCYARLRDAWVGATNCSPPGQHPIWTPGLIACSHLSLTQDRRILVDLARRLRGESPWATASEPPCD
ncbi:MAG: GPI inositol-deacylase [Phycisphaerales bacterium]|nr:GPI inositol-deacylase [Phycisphaerales bacterium]